MRAFQFLARASFAIGAVCILVTPVAGQGSARPDLSGYWINQYTPDLSTALGKQPPFTAAGAERWRTVDTAKDPKYFTFIQNCEPNLTPVIGDARLTFAREPSGTYDVIIVDAYSSDAIPIHLATEEAMEIYKDKLAPQGAVVMHVSNRHLELESVVVGIAEANDLKSWVYNEDSGRDNEYIFSTSVVVSAREEADVGSLASSDKWALTEAEDHHRVWTDDYSNILGAVWRRLRNGEE